MHLQVVHKENVACTLGEIQLDFHWITRPWRRTLTSGRDVKTYFRWPTPRKCAFLPYVHLNFGSAVRESENVTKRKWRSIKWLQGGHSLTVMLCYFLSLHLWIAAKALINCIAHIGSPFRLEDRLILSSPQTRKLRAQTAPVDQGGPEGEGGRDLHSSPPVVSRGVLPTRPPPPRPFLARPSFPRAAFPNEAESLWAGYPTDSCPVCWRWFIFSLRSTVLSEISAPAVSYWSVSTRRRTKWSACCRIPAAAKTRPTMRPKGIVVLCCSRMYRPRIFLLCALWLRLWERLGSQ